MKPLIFIISILALASFSCQSNKFLFGEYSIENSNQENIIAFVNDTLCTLKYKPSNNLNILKNQEVNSFEVNYTLGSKVRIKGTKLTLTGKKVTLKFRPIFINKIINEDNIFVNKSDIDSSKVTFIPHSRDTILALANGQLFYKNQYYVRKIN